jgi:mannitol/fructose-specific phosphotransferase system IIA component (Ntr-type)
MKLNDFIAQDALIPQLKSTDRDESVGELLDALIDAGCVPGNLRNELIQKIIEREDRGSTGFGKGVAVPHVKHSGIDKMVATIGISERGVEFNALDKAPVYSIVLLVSPLDKPDEHLHAMENIFRNLQKDLFRTFLRQAGSVEEILDLVQEADAHLLQG